jgi:hypothetical protein
MLQLQQMSSGGGQSQGLIPGLFQQQTERNAAASQQADRDAALSQALAKEQTAINLAQKIASQQPSAANQAKLAAAQKHLDLVRSRQAAFDVAHPPAKKSAVDTKLLIGGAIALGLGGLGFWWWKRRK